MGEPTSRARRARVGCIADRMITSRGMQRVPMVTKGKFYVVVDKDLQVMGEQDGRLSVVGDDGCQVDLPRNLFGRILTD